MTQTKTGAANPRPSVGVKPLLRLPTGDLMKRLMNDVAFNLAKQREDLIEAAISTVTGEPYNFKKVKNRLGYQRVADTDRFYIDNKELIEFYPVKFDTNYDENKFNSKIECSQQYRLLYKNWAT